MLAGLLCEGAQLRRKQREHRLRRAAKPDTLWRHNNRAIDEDRVRFDCVEQLRVRQRGIAKIQFCVGRAFLSQDIADPKPHARDELDQKRAGWWCLQIFDHMRLDASVADHGQCVA